jgi:hypothetical protein
MKNNGEQNIELNVELAHDLRGGDDYNVLVINKGSHHQAFEKVDESTHHTITWTLTGNASTGEFCALDDAPNPGFVWLFRKPSEKIFHKLALKGKNKVTIHNHHHNKNSEGTWHYQLFERFGDKVYGVPLTFSAGGGNNPNPSIKNN